MDQRHGAGIQPLGRAEGLETSAARAVSTVSWQKNHPPGPAALREKHSRRQFAPAPGTGQVSLHGYLVSPECVTLALNRLHFRRQKLIARVLRRAFISDIRGKPAQVVHRNGDPRGPITLKSLLSLLRNESYLCAIANDDAGEKHLRIRRRNGDHCAAVVSVDNCRPGAEL